MSSAAPRRSAMGLLRVYFRESAQMRSWTCLQPTDCRKDISHDMAGIKSFLDVLQDIFESPGEPFPRPSLAERSFPILDYSFLAGTAPFAMKIVVNWSQERSRIRPHTPARRHIVSPDQPHSFCMPAVLQALSNAVTTSITL